MRLRLPYRVRLNKKIWPIPSSQPSPRQTRVPHQNAVPAAYYRGGTSRAFILQPQDLPADRSKWRGIFRQIVQLAESGKVFGRDFYRHGAGASSLNKLCLVEPYFKSEEDSPSTPKASTAPRPGQLVPEESVNGPEPDIDYTFVHMDNKTGYVDTAANCGNVASAIGPYAYNMRLLPPSLYAIKDGTITVRMRNTNTMKLVESTFAVSGGQAEVKGEFKVDGVNGKASKITMDYPNPNGSKTGKAFPTGNHVDEFHGCKVTCVDGASPVVFIRADTIGVPGTILPHEFVEHKDRVKLLEKIRRAAAVAMGIAATEKTVPYTTPNIAVVSQSSTHSVLTGAPGSKLKASQMDLVVRFISGAEPHSAVPLTGALTTAVAAQVPGTIVEQLLAPEQVVDGALTIGHPSGRISVRHHFDKTREPPVWVASVCTTAKRLFEGRVFYTSTSNVSAPEPEPEAEAEAEAQQHSLGLAFVNELRAREGLPKQPNDEPADLNPVPLQNPNAHPSPSETNHLLRELATLRTSLTHFSSLYPSPPLPRARPSRPTPARISCHLAAISQHIDMLTASLSSWSTPTKRGVQWDWLAASWDAIRRERDMDWKVRLWSARENGGWVTVPGLGSLEKQWGRDGTGKEEHPGECEVVEVDDKNEDLPIRKYVVREKPSWGLVGCRSAPRRKKNKLRERRHGAGM